MQSRHQNSIDAMARTGRQPSFNPLTSALDDTYRRAPATSLRAAALPSRSPKNVKLIEDVEIGDLVWAWDEAEGQLVKRRVTRVFRRSGRPVLRVVYGSAIAGQQCVKSTTEHPFWVEGKGWVPAGELAEGNLLKRLGGGDGTRDAIAVQQVMDAGTSDVFNFEVLGVHNYFVGARGVLVHNQSQLPINQREFSSPAEVAVAYGKHALSGALRPALNHPKLSAILGGLLFTKSLIAGHIREQRIQAVHGGELRMPSASQNVAVTGVLRKNVGVVTEERMIPISINGKTVYLNAVNDQPMGQPGTSFAYTAVNVLKQTGAKMGFKHSGQVSVDIEFAPPDKATYQFASPLVETGNSWMHFQLNSELDNRESQKANRFRFRSLGVAAPMGDNGRVSLKGFKTKSPNDDVFVELYSRDTTKVAELNLLSPQLKAQGFPTAQIYANADLQTDGVQKQLTIGVRPTAIGGGYFEANATYEKVFGYKIHGDIGADIGLGESLSIIPQMGLDFNIGAIGGGISFGYKPGRGAFVGLGISALVGIRTTFGISVKPKLPDVDWVSGAGPAMLPERPQTDFSSLARNLYVGFERTRARPTGQLYGSIPHYW
jgi:hypothetical protein